MANEGMLLTFVVSMVGAGTYALAAHQVWNADGKRRHAVFIFCLAAALYLFLAGGRLLFGYAGLHEVDRIMFLMAGAPAFLSVVPLVHLMASILSRSTIATWVATGVSASAALVGLALFYAGGIVPLETNYWATEYRFGNPWAGKMLVKGVLEPAIGASVVMLLVGIGLEGESRKRALAFATSAAVFFVTLTTDGLAVSGGILIIERTIMAATAILIYRTYRNQPVERPPLPPLPPSA